MPLFMFYL